MPPRRRARVSIPSVAGLDRESQEVGQVIDVDDADPWSEKRVQQSVRKTWADSFEDPEDRFGSGKSADEPNGPDYWFKAEVSEVDFDVHFRLGVTNEGALVVTGLLLGDPGGTQPITTSNLHRLPIGTIYEAISRLDDVTTAVADKARPYKGEVPTRGGQKTPDEEFEQVAQLYQECLLERPNDPIKCVAEKLDVSSATASRRVSRARDLGLLLRNKDDARQAAKIIEHQRYIALRDVILTNQEIIDGVEVKLATETLGDERESKYRAELREMEEKQKNRRITIWRFEEKLGIPQKDRLGYPF